jgi:hypothetical protein
MSSDFSPSPLLLALPRCTRASRACIFFLRRGAASFTIPVNLAVKSIRSFLKSEGGCMTSGCSTRQSVYGLFCRVNEPGQHLHVSVAPKEWIWASRARPQISARNRRRHLERGPTMGKICPCSPQVTYQSTLFTKSIEKLYMNPWEKQQSSRLSCN